MFSKDTLFLRAWIIADGVTIPAIAHAQQIRVKDTQVTLTFQGGGGELYATVQGFKYTKSRPISPIQAKIICHQSPTTIIGLQQGEEISSDAQRLSSVIAYFENQQRRNDLDNRTLVEVFAFVGASEQEQGSHSRSIWVDAASTPPLVYFSPDLKEKEVIFFNLPKLNPPAILINSRITSENKGDVYVRQWKICFLYCEAKHYRLSIFDAAYVPDKAKIPDIKDKERSLSFILNKQLQTLEL